MSIIRKNKEDKLCGECCWFYGEMTDGEGLCAHNPMFNEFCNTCGSPACNDYVSRQEMRHHMAVLLQAVRRHIAFYGKKDALTDASEFAYKYMKVFSEL